MTTSILYFKKNNSVIWSIKYNLETIAGCIAASLPVLADMDDAGGHYMDTDTNIDYFLAYNNVPEEAINYKSPQFLQDKEYGLWIRSENGFDYNLYRFKTSAFIQGIISVCNLFSIDFRDYIYGLPFDKNGQTYYFNNYSMVPPVLYSDAIDLDDVEEEEEDNENLIQLVHNIH